MSAAFIRDLRGRKSPSNTKKIKIGVLGCGSMGSAAVRRLASFPTSFVVNVWNRTFEKAENLGANAYRSAEGMIAKSDVVVIFLGNLEIARNVISSIPGSCFRGKHVISLVSSSPTDAKAFAKFIRGDNRDICSYVDGAYAGAPSTVLDGSGLIMASTDTLDDPPSIVNETLCTLGRVEYVQGKMGCAKAIDYAIVDMYFANLIFFLNGLGMIEAEGVSSEALLNLLEYKLPTYTKLFRGQMERIDRRDYESSITATLRTWLAFFDGRTDWMKHRNLNTRTIDFAKQLLRDSGACDKVKKFRDAYCVQEILRFNQQKQAS